MMIYDMNGYEEPDESECVMNRDLYRKEAVVLEDAFEGGKGDMCMKLGVLLSIGRT